MNIPVTPNSPTMKQTSRKPYSTVEKQAIADARESYPQLSQRGLADLLFVTYNQPGTPGHRLALRSRQSIYAAIRRYDERQRATVQNLAVA